MSQLLMLLPSLPAHPRTGPFRPARDGDEAGIARVLATGFPEVEWNAEIVARDLTHGGDVLDVFVAEGDDGIVATASGRHDVARFPGAGYVHLVVVAPHARGRGLGVDAVSAVLAGFRERGFEQAVLETDDDRLAALSGYLRLGFVPVYRQFDHYARWSEIMRALAERRSTVSA